MSEGNTIWTPVSQIVRDFLISLGVGVAYSPTGTWPIATAAAPKAPANCITLADEAALKKARTINGVIEDPVISIEVRSERYAEGYEKAKVIQQSLDELSFYSWDSSSISVVSQTVVIATASRTRGIFPMGVDENNRWKFNLEYALVIQSVEG